MTANLQAAIRRIDAGPGTSALPLLAQTADVDRRLISRVLAGQPINASAYLKLCGALGLDPVTGKPVPATAIGNIEWWFFAGDLREKRIAKKLTCRAAAEEAGIAPTTFFRAEAGISVSAESYLALCRFIGLHPHHYTRGFTGNNLWNSHAPRSETAA